MMKIYCCNCQDSIDAFLVTGKEIYPHRPDLYNKKFYKCPICNGYVGCHKGTIKPLGVIPTEELKRERIKIHNKMDILWKSGTIKRSKLYKLISNKLGYTYHNGTTKDIKECKRVLTVIDDIKREIEVKK